MIKKHFYQIGIGDDIGYASLLDNPQPFNLAGYDDVVWTGTLVDFQPSVIQSTFGLLEKQIESRRIEIVNAVVSSNLGLERVEFADFCGIDNQAMIVGADNDVPHKSEYTYFTAAITLNVLISRAPSPVGLLALDVQGSESDILEGFFWSDMPELVVVEIHSSLNRNRVFKVLKDQGYQFVKDVTYPRFRENALFMRKGSQILKV